MPKIIVFGDHRRPIWIDPRARSMAARKVIFSAIAEERPDLVLDTGDLVPDASARSWNLFDRDRAVFDKFTIPMEAVPGNHETYGILPRSANANIRMKPFLLRFPRNTQKRWGTRDVGNIRILLLDSNVNALSEGEIGEQEKFIIESVAGAESDSNIKLMIAAWHHPPFTNTTIYGDDRFSARSFLPRLRASRKLGAIFCGHVHGYERFWVESISLVVTGGGGAHRHAFPRDHKHWRHTPAYNSYHSPHLHYVSIQFDGGAGRAVVRHLQQITPEPEWTSGDEFEIRPK